MRRLRLTYSSDEDEEPEPQPQAPSSLTNPPEEELITSPNPNPTPLHSEPSPLEISDNGDVVDISDNDDFIDVSDNLSPPSPPPPPAPNNDTQPPPPSFVGSRIGDFLLGLGLRLKREWIAFCVQGLEQSVPGFGELEVSMKAKLCFERFLVSDMNQSGGGVLPENVDRFHLVDLPGPYVLQVGFHVFK